MFHYGRFFGQNEADIYSAYYVPPVEPSEARFIPIYAAQAPAIEAALSTPEASVYSGILPVLQNIVSGAAPVVAEFLKLQQVKSQAAAISTMTPTQQAAYLAATAPKVVTPVQAGFALPSNWPILGIIAIGAFLVLRGRKSAVSVRGKRIRRRR